MKYQALFFDFDDCLFATANDRTWTTLQTLHQNGYTRATWEVARSHLGQNTVDRILKTAGIEDRAEGERLARLWDETNLRVGYPTAYPFTGVAETLKALDDHPMGICSASLTPVIEGVLGRYNFTSYFKAVIGKEKTPEPKPSPKGLFDLCETIGVDPASCLFVGDTPDDVQAGNAAGMMTVAVTYGFGTRESLGEKKPDRLIDWFPDLVAIARRGL
jgi:HAD superfamily hydrolase (TIGR01549 family)